MQFPGLDNSTSVLVTAGAAGIGRSIAEAFLAAGARVHVCDVDVDAIARFVAENPRVSATRTDVADPAAVDELFAELSGVGVSVLVNNAGIAGPTAQVEDIEVEAWNRCIAVDLSGAFFCTRRAVPLLKKSAGGCIINIASNAGLFGLPLRSAYVASKWALIGLTKTWAMELGPDRVRVNALCPGSVVGERIERVIEREAEERRLTPERVRQAYLRHSSMRVFVEPREVAAMALFLASDLGRHVSGQVIGVDGHTEGLPSVLSE